MASGVFTLYSANKDDLRINDLLSATVKLALVTSSYTPNTASNGHELWATVSANELPNGGGYTTGGATLGTKAANAITNGFNFDSADPSWTASGGGIPAHRYYVMYVSGSLWGKTDPLIGYFIGDNTPADIPLTTAGNPLAVTVHANGWFDLV